jgi:putative isomerase
LTGFSARQAPPEDVAAAVPGGWDTWDAAWPASLVHLPSGACVRIGAYSASAGAYTEFPWSPAHVLGTHLIGGDRIEARFEHAGTTLSLRAAAAGESAVRAELRCSGLGEWGLRFWIVLEFGSWERSGPGTRLLLPAGERAYTDPPAAVLEGAGAMTAAFCSLDRPVDARLSAQRGAVGRAMAAEGYYARPASAGPGRLAVFRFTAAEPVVVFAAAAGPDQVTALDRARQALRSVAESPGSAAEPSGSAAEPSGPAAESSSSRPPRQPRASGGTREAIRDVLGWNTVWDRPHRRAYTASTRAWIDPKFGGFGVWQIDGFLHAVLAAHLGESSLAWANIGAVLAGRTARGNLPALAAGSTLWQDRSHPPFGTHVLWNVQARAPDDGKRSRAAGVLLGAFDWWFRARDGNGNGLLEYGSSPVGDGHFVHTRQAAMDESANDNSPVHDEARFDLAAHTLDVEDVGLNSLLVHEAELLAGLLEADGRGQDVRRVSDRAAVLAEAVRTRLWDADREVFAGRHWDGRFTRSLAPTSFYPLLAGIATREQAEAMVRRWLSDPDRFGGSWPVAGTPHDDPAAADNVYWRGRVWPCFNYAVYLGLRRYRFDAEASWLARRGLELFARGWADRRCYENFSQRTGQGGDSPDAEPFYTWGALLPFLADADLIGVDPWDGVTFGRDGTGPGSAGTSIGGTWHEVAVTDASTTLSRDGTAVLAASLRGRFRHLEIAAGRLSVEIPPAGREVTVEAALDRPAVTVRLDGGAVAADRLHRPRPGTVSARLDPSAGPRRLEFEGRR